MTKKIIFIIVPIIILIITVIAVTVMYFTTDLFKSNEELFWKYFAQNESMINIIKNDKQLGQFKFKKDNSYEGNGKMSFSIEQGTGNIKKFDINTVSKHDAINDRNHTDVILKNGELNLFQVSLLRNKDIYGLKCAEVYQNYVGFQNVGLSQLAEKYGIDNAKNLPDSIGFQEYTKLLELTEEQKNHLISTYLPIIKKNINKEEYTQNDSRITIDFSELNSNIYTYDVTAHKINISGEKLKKILMDCANVLKSDTETLISISDILSAVGWKIECTDTASLSLKIEELVTKLSETTIKNNLEITLYEYDGNLIRTSINFGTQFIITYDKMDDTEMLTIDISNTTFTNTIEKTINAIETNNKNEENISEDIIDLNQTGEINENKESISRICIIKNDSTIATINEIRVIPDINNIEENITFTINMSNVQDGNINNSYTLILNRLIDNKRENIVVTYESNICKVEQVEEIEEVNSNNIVIANYYEPEAFMSFFSEYINIFRNKLAQKMVTLGFDEWAISY